MYTAAMMAATIKAIAESMRSVARITPWRMRNQLTAAHQACGGNTPIALPPWHCEAVQGQRAVDLPVL
jgi:hypothetical protein